MCALLADRAPSGAPVFIRRQPAINIWPLCGQDPIVKLKLEFPITFPLPSSSIRGTAHASKSSRKTAERASLPALY